MDKLTKEDILKAKQKLDCMRIPQSAFPRIVWDGEYFYRITRDRLREIKVERIADDEV